MRYMEYVSKLAKQTKAYVAMLMAYPLLTLLLPANSKTAARYQLTDMQYHSLLILVLLPLIAAWAITYYSYRQLDHYADGLKDNAEAEQFHDISRGLRVLAWGLPIISIVSTILNSIVDQFNSVFPANLIIPAYLSVIMSLVAFLAISRGVHDIAQRARLRVAHTSLRWIVLGIVSFTLFVCYFVGQNLSGGAGNAFNSYYVANWLVWATIILPFLFAWTLGFFAAAQLIAVARNTAGIIYQQALQLLASGLLLCMLAMTALQCFRAITPRTGFLTLGATLLTTYLIYAVHALGCVILANGAKKLKRIEDV